MYTFNFIISIYGLLRSREIIRVWGEKSTAMANYLQDSLWTNCNLPEQLKVMQTLPCKVAQRWHFCCQCADLHINCSLPQAGRELEKCQSWGLRAGSEQSGSRIGSGVLSQTNNEQKQEKMTIIWGAFQLSQHTLHTDRLSDHIWLLSICITSSSSAWISSSAHDAGSSQLPSCWNDVMGVMFCNVQNHDRENSHCKLLKSRDWHAGSSWFQKYEQSYVCLIYNTVFTENFLSKHVYEQWERAGW